MLSLTRAMRGKETGYPQRGFHQKDARLATSGMMYVVIQEQEKVTVEVVDLACQLELINIL